MNLSHLIPYSIKLPTMQILTLRDTLDIIYSLSLATNSDWPYSQSKRNKTQANMIKAIKIISQSTQ